MKKRYRNTCVKKEKLESLHFLEHVNISKKAWISKEKGRASLRPCRGCLNAWHRAGAMKTACCKLSEGTESASSSTRWQEDLSHRGHLQTDMRLPNNLSSGRLSMHGRVREAEASQENLFLCYWFLLSAMRGVFMCVAIQCTKS